MQRFRRTLSYVILVVLVLTAALTIITSDSHAQSWVLGPVSLDTNNPQVGQTISVSSTFQASCDAGENYVLDTEVYSSGGTRVAQWIDTVKLDSSQKVTRKYSWQTSGLAPDTYNFKLGIFKENWGSLLSWNDEAKTVKLSKETPTSFVTAAHLKDGSPKASVADEISGTYKISKSGNYILDLEVFDANNGRAAQWFENRSVTAGKEEVLKGNWTPASSGSFTVKMGIFDTSWQLLSWDDSAKTIKVATAPAVTATPEPTATPAPTSTPVSTTAPVTTAAPAPTTTPVPTVSPAPEPVTTPTTNPVNPGKVMVGVNLASAEFGNTMPGTYNSDYVYPTAEELAYYNSKGLNLIRLPFKWERLQRTLNGPLDTTELGYMDTFVAAARAKGMKIIIDPHNYARYKLNGTEYLIGSNEVPVTAYADFMGKLAAHFKGDKAIYGISLMNEPHDTNNTWKATAQAGLDAIRSVDKSVLVLVPGDSWSGAWTWQQVNSQLLLNDPSNNLVYEAHQYFDSNGSGTYTNTYDNDGANPNIGVDRIKPFTQWLKANNVRGIITEFGVPNNDPRWLTVLDNFLNALSSEGISSTYWAGGPWWGSYMMSSEPVNGQDAPVTKVLTKHLGS